MDADEDRSQILANFQACTNIDDIGHALAVLDAAGWNLSAAVSQVLDGESDPTPMHTEPHEFLRGAAASAASPGLGLIGHAMHPPPPDPGAEFPLEGANPSVRNIPPSSGYVGTRSDSPTQREVIDDDGIARRLIRFHANYDSKLEEVEMMDSLTIDDLKDLISNKINVDKSLFSIVWQDDRLAVEDNMTLRELNLPRENTLHIIPLTSEQASTSSTTAHSRPVTSAELNQELNQRFKLKVEITLPTGARFSNDYIEAHDRTIAQVKEDIFRHYGFKVSDQLWQGWPEQATDDDMILGNCNLDTPVHKLTVTLKPSANNQNNAGEQNQASTSAEVGGARPRVRNPPPPTGGSQSAIVVHNSDSESEMSETMGGYDSDPEITIAPLRRNVNTNLIPAHITDPGEAASHFNTVFAQRYGTISCPVFFHGSLKDAVDNALQCNALDRRLLAVYLHHDDSIASNVFCSQVLCSETIVNYITSNFLLWGWDLTLEVNRNRFYRMFEQVMGKGADFVKRLSTDQLPVMVIVSKVRGSIEILGSSSPSTVTADELMTTLLQAEDVFQDQRQNDIKEEQERREREDEKKRQDEAYEESLARDRVKQQQKEEEERAKQAEIEAQQLEQQTQEAIRQSVADTIPEEPAADSSELMARLRFRCPNGEMINRRFLGTTPLNILLNYLVTQGYNTQEYKVLTTYPRRDISQESTKKTLEDLKLCPQETLILEER